MLLLTQLHDSVLCSCPPARLKAALKAKTVGMLLIVIPWSPAARIAQWSVAQMVAKSTIQ